MVSTMASTSPVRGQEVEFFAAKATMEVNGGQVEKSL